MPVVTKGLDALRGKLAILTSARLVPELAQRVAASEVKLIADGFRKQEDPYGDKWKPLQRERPRNKRARLKRERKGLKSRGVQVLVDKGLMKASANAQPSGNLVRANVGMHYSIFHQGGTEHMPRRMMLPNNLMGIPPRWGQVIERDADKLIKEKLRGAR
jgi:hypothetical protein